ncbi:MAG: fimbrillin family protein [Bacteroidaceae bacterium]|nr:fimbrillin family protein [Bacteroidaceae bacterium]
MMRGFKLLIVAAFAIIMAGCSNESVFRETEATAGAVISFQSYSEKPTKAINDTTTLEFYHNTFAVYATSKDKRNNQVQVVFGTNPTGNGTTSNGTVCTYSGSSWNYSAPRVWDNHSNYRFIAYAPAITANPLRFTYGTSTEVGKLGVDGRDLVANGFYLTGENLQSHPSDKLKHRGFSTDLDLMTSDTVSHQGTNHNPVNLLFKHILAKINVRVRKTANLNDPVITIDSIFITGLADKGSYRESSYNLLTNDSTGWTVDPDMHNPDYMLAYRTYNGAPELPDANNSDPGYVKLQPLHYIESLIIPQAITTIDSIHAYWTVTRQESATETVTEPFESHIALSETEFTSFLDRMSYTIIFTVDSDDFYFITEFEHDWGDEETTEEPIEPSDL